MKRLTKSIRLAALVTLIALCCLTSRAQIATWNNSTGDNDWNNALNWDIGVPAEGTNAVIGAANTVNYNTPMTATSFGMLDLNSAVLNLNAAGFVPGASGSAVSIQSVSSGNNFPINGLYVGNGGVVSVPNGNLVLTNNSVVSIAAGGSLSIGGTLQVGGVSGNNDLRVCVTNRGGMLSATATTLNPNNAAGASQGNLGAAVYILGGTNNLGDVTIRRAPAAGTESNDAAGKQGLVISNGLVRTTSLDVGGPNGNSWLTMFVAGGTVTNSGSFTVRTTGTANRGSRFYQFGGLFVSPSANNIHLRGQTAANGLVTYSVAGGTNIVTGFVIADVGDTIGTVNMTNAGKIYIGSGGITMEGSLTATNIMLNNGGVFGATDNWTGAVPINLNGGTIDAADLNGTPHNISLPGVLRGAGALIKTGGGTLTLNAAATYSGNTLVNAGTLALGLGGSIASSSQIIVAGGASFDVSAVSGFTLGGGRTLGGSGTVIGDVALASGGIISPGTSPGTMTLASALTETGGAVNHFDLPTTPGPGNDLLVVNGALNVSGVNTIEIVGGGSPGTVHTLIQYGSFNGTLANFTISGTTGILSNNPTTKTISLMVQSVIRGPTNVVWVGNSIVNDWDTVNRTNWLNAGTLDFFVFGDSVLFGATGAANPIVNVVGNVSPASTTVGAAANYTFSGGGNITGTGGLTKTNTGTLTVLTTNAYTGVTTIGGGALEVSLLAIGGANSGIGAASVDPNNLLIDGGTLRYLGGSVTTDRGMTANSGGATIDIASNGTTLTESGLVNGNGVLTKAGPGTLVLAGANGYSGGTVINAGQLQVNGNTAAGTGGITNNGATLRIQGALTLDNAMSFSGTCTLDIANAGGNTATRGAWSGSGTVNFINVDPNNRTVTIGGAGAGGGHMWDFSGTVDYGTNSGFFRINNDNSTFNFGSSNATFNVGTGTATLNQRNGGTTTHLGALIGGPSTKLSGRGGTGASGTTTYSIGAKNLSTTFGGEINNGSGTTAIIKVGTGTLTLSGTSIHTGTSTVAEGTLQVDGNIATSSVSVTGGTLSGNGTFGLVDVQPNGILSPGASIGQMTISTLAFQPGSTNIMELNKSASTNDNIIGLTGVSYAGILVVTNLAGALAENDTFKLFDAAPGSYVGAFDTIILPTVAAPLVWDTSGLTLDGTIKLLVPHESRPTISTAKIEDSDFVLRGTNNGNSSTYYYVLTSTNIASPLSSWKPLATNQFEVDGTFAVTNAFNSRELRRFYLLKTP